MSTPSHHRFKITHKGQHPYNHDASEIGYSGEAFPDVMSVNAALDYISGVLYPNLKPAVANVAALPALGNALNDYRLVMDDGDGKSAGYRWAKYEDEVSPSWHKIYDIDWGLGDVLSATEAATQANYVYKWGRNDKDASGIDIVGLYAGSRIYGGDSASTNLTLQANSADADGAAANQTGYVQVDSQFRPAYHNSYDAGTNAIRWRNIYAETGIISGTLSLASGLITDSSGAISFNDENITTTGFMHMAALVASGTALINADITIASGSITSASGAISFNDENLTTTGYFQAGNLRLTTNTLSSQNANGNINIDPNGTGTIELVGDTNVTGSMTGTVNIDFAGYGEFGNLRLTTNTISSQNANGNIIFTPNGSGIAQFSSDVSMIATLDVTGYVEANLLRVGTGAGSNEITTFSANRNIIFRPNGTGIVVTSANFTPESDGGAALGTTALRFSNLFLSGSIGDGTNTMTAANLMTLRDINVGVASGMSLFYDGTKWVASIPDTEITHNTLSGLTTGDAGHTQFALLAGRAGGQSLIGGTAATEHLTFESTSNASKGFVKTKDSFVPFTTASFSGTWSGTDLGGSSNYFRHVYTKGEHFGMRLENITVLPANSAQNIGRILFDTGTATVYVDAGGSWVTFVSASAFLQNGNTFGADARLGTNDNFQLIFETNDTIAATIGTDQSATFVSLVSVSRLNLTGNTSPSNGFYLADTNTIGISTNATQRWNVNASGHLEPGANNTYRIGSGSFRLSNVVSELFYGSNGTAAAPTHTFADDDNTGIYRFGADILGFTMGGSNKFRMSSADLRALAADMYIINNGTDTIGGGSIFAMANTAVDRFVYFQLDASNNMMIARYDGSTQEKIVSFQQDKITKFSKGIYAGTTTNLFSTTGSFTVQNSTFVVELELDGSANNGINIDDTNAAAGTDLAINFRRGGSQVGRIETTTTTTSYQTTSDYRLKKNFRVIDNATALICETPVYQFNWKNPTDIHDVFGFKAHEIQKIVPYAVSGKKDEVLEGNLPVYQSMDHSKLVPILWAAIQENYKEIEKIKLETQILRNELEELKGVS